MDLSGKIFNIYFKHKKEVAYLHVQYIILHLCKCIYVYKLHFHLYGFINR